MAARQLQQLLVAGRGGGNGHLLERRAGGGGHDRGGVGVFVGVDPDDELGAATASPGEGRRSAVRRYNRA
jgi:hypothetical protein